MDRRFDSIGATYELYAFIQSALRRPMPISIDHTVSVSSYRRNCCVTPLNNPWDRHFADRRRQYLLAACMAKDGAKARSVEDVVLKL